MSTFSLDQLTVRAAKFAAFAIPLTIGILASSIEPYWLDSPEFTAAAQTLGLPHPPGHPLYVMLVKPFTLLPFGGIAFRVSLASAVFGALASYLLFLISFATIERVSKSFPIWACASVSCFAALTVAVAPGWWFQCVRAEVYSLQILLVLGAIYPMLLFALGRRENRLLYIGSFIAGLGLTNHHFIMISVLPAVIPLLVAQTRTIGGLGVGKLVAKLSALGIVGLTPYLFIPLRSLANPAVALGGANSGSDLFWVISARVYQKSMAKEHTDYLSDRSLDAIFTLMGQIGPVILVAALAGMYLLMRNPRTRLAAVMVLLMIGVTVLLRSIMGFDPFNPDYYGYMLPALAGLAIGLAAMVAVFLSILRNLFKLGPVVAAILVIAMATVPIMRGRSARTEVDLSQFRATRLFVDMTITSAPEKALVLTSYYNLFFVLWSAQFIDGSRPDVVTVNPQLLGYPGYLRATVQAHPMLTGLARSMLINAKLTERAVAELAWQGPLLVEPSPFVEPSVNRYMIPNGPVYEALASPQTQNEVKKASKNHFKKWQKFYHLVGQAWQEHETKRMLSWCHYQDAMFMAARGHRDGARKSIDMAKAIGSKAEQMENLSKALENKEETGPLDITPYLP